MSDDLNELQRRQEGITAAHLPPDVELDQESAELRATWLAFGKLLDAARATAGQSTPISWPPRTSRSWRWPFLAFVALSASVFLAVTAALYRRGGMEATRPASPNVARKNVDAPADSGNRKSTNSAPAAQSLASVPNKAKPEVAVSRRTRLDWSDTLDQQMDRVGHTIVQVQDDVLASAGGVELIQYQWKDIRKGMDDGVF